MSENFRNRALVLSGGGARGAYQAGVLKYLAEHVPEAHFETLVGSSSGAINVAGLASYKGDIVSAGPKIAKLWSELEINQVFRVDFFSIVKIGIYWLYDLTIGGVRGKPMAQSLVDTSPLRKLLNSLLRPDNIREAIESGKLKNVAVSATEVYSGSLVTFVQSKTRKVWHRARKRSKNTQIGVEHIMASSAIPLLFPSAVVDNRRYVDGCIRSTAPLSPAARLGAEKIFAIGIRRYYTKEIGNNWDADPLEPEPKASVAQLGALVLNSLFSESLDADAEHLERLNTMIANQQEGSFTMRKIDVLVIRPSEDLGTLAQEFHKELPLLVRYLLRGLGSEAGDSSDILSYLLFAPSFTSRLVELGYQDAREEHARIKHFFAD